MWSTLLYDLFADQTQKHERNAQGLSSGQKWAAVGLPAVRNVMGTPGSVTLQFQMQQERLSA